MGIRSRSCLLRLRYAQRNLCSVCSGDGRSLLFRSRQASQDMAEGDSSEHQSALFSRNYLPNASAIIGKTHVLHLTPNCGPHSFAIALLNPVTPAFAIA